MEGACLNLQFQVSQQNTSSRSSFCLLQIQIAILLSTLPHFILSTGPLLVSVLCKVFGTHDPKQWCTESHTVIERRCACDRGSNTHLHVLSTSSARHVTHTLAHTMDPCSHFVSKCALCTHHGVLCRASNTILGSYLV